VIINLVFDAAALAAPAAFRNTLLAAANSIASMFSDNITISLGIEYNENGIGSGGAEAGPSAGLFENYSTIYADLKNGASPGDSSFDSLPAPGSGTAPSTLLVWAAELKALGFSATSAETLFAGQLVDGIANFSATISPSLLFGVALHELTHAMGRVPDDNADIFELFRFSSAGNRVYDGNVPANESSYFSLNGGLTKWADYGVQSDPSDFINNYSFDGDGPSPLSPEDSFNQFYDSSTLQYLTPLDLESMDVLGFHLKQNAPTANAYDFNGQNSGDILLQNSSGQIEYANMAGGSFQGFVNVTNTPGWNVVGQGKISGGVDSDIVIQNGGQIEYANLVNGVFSNWVYVTNTPGWSVVGVADVNDDHYADIIIQNLSTGAADYINMANGVFHNFVGLPSTPGWNIVGVADVNNDGFADIIIENSSGSIEYGNLANGVFNNWVFLGGAPGWNVVGTGDITRLGDVDVVIQDPIHGGIDYANIVNGAFSNWVSLGQTPGWKVIGVEDILGNGYDDIVIQNSTTGQIEYADMTGGSFQGWVNITTPPSGFVGKTGPGGGSSDAPGAGAAGTSVATAAGDGILGNSAQTAAGGAPGPDGSFNQSTGTATGGAPGFNQSTGIAVDNGSNGGVTMYDSPGLGIASSASLLQTAAAAAGIEQSASWLTAGSNLGASSIGSAGAPDNSGFGTNAAPITADNLHTALHFGS